jgi:predicted acylesterase/phospholipase RssA
MRGGVSLAVWIGGVCNELLRLVREGEDLTQEDLERDAPDPAWPAYRMLCWAAGVRPRVDVMAGASAGGMNGVFLALGLLYGHEDLALLRSLWIESGSFQNLLRDPLDSRPPSLLQGDEYFLPQLEDAIRVLCSGPRDCSDLPIDLQLTVTSMQGEPVDRYDDRGTRLQELKHDHVLRFRNDDDHRDFGRPGAGIDELRDTITRLARASRSTASFPGAFEPSLARVGPDGRDGRFTPEQAPSLTRDHYLIDGGTLVNLPVRPAIDAIFDQPGSGEVRRVFALVVPDPGRPQVVSSEPEAPPSIREVVSGALSSIPRNQTVLGFLDDLEGRNVELARTRIARRELVVSKPAAELHALAVPLLRAYCESRASSNLKSLRARLFQAFDEWARTPVAAGLTAAEVATARGGWNWALGKVLAEPTAMPWIPPTLDAADSGRWGWSTVKRSAARALQLLDLDAGASTGALRLRVFDALRGLDTKDVDLRDLDWMADTEASIRAFFAALAPRGAEYAARIDILADVLVAASAAGSPVMALQGLDHTKAVELLLSLEVIENAFGSFDRQTEQPVEVVRIDGNVRSPLDLHARYGADGKVAGVQLGHFGSFLKASWRANDWMWGRLDGANQLVDLMIGPAAQESEEARLPRRLKALAEVLDVADLGEGAAIDVLRRRLNADIAVEEAPAIRDALEQDAVAGGNDTSSAVLIRQMPRQPATADPAVREGFARDFLTADQIGKETIAEEAGSDLFTHVSVQALSTGASLVRSTSPRVLVPFASLVRFVSLMAYGLLRSRRGGASGRVLAALAFGIGLTLTVVRFYSGTSVGILGPIGLALLAGGTIVTFLEMRMILYPALVIGLVPVALTYLPDDSWGFYPDRWWWPSLHEYRWVGSVSLLVAGIVIGFAKRPKAIQERRAQKEAKARTAKMAAAMRAAPADGSPSPRP